MAVEEKYMHRCLQLAALGAGNVAPNPMVGALLEVNGMIIGEGYHKKYGGPHAEVNCINNVSEQNRRLIKKAVLYVSLEPCAHYGKTPPCADLIIKTGIPKVVIGCRDLYKDVNGKGIRRLLDAGVEVITGVLERECLEANRRFFTFHQKQRPYIILKWAQSLNGKIGNAHGRSPDKRKLISNEYTNRLVHKWRSEEAAIMVGTNTALYDDPSLTVRLWKGADPVRIIPDKQLRLPAHLKIFDKEAKTIIFNKSRTYEEENLVYHQLNAGDDVGDMLKALHTMNIQSILVEGGAKLLQSFIDKKLWDEVRIICNDEMLIADGEPAPELPACQLEKKEIFSGDTILYFKPLEQA